MSVHTLGCFLFALVQCCFPCSRSHVRQVATERKILYSRMTIARIGIGISLWFAAYVMSQSCSAVSKRKRLKRCVDFAGCAYFGYEYRESGVMDKSISGYMEVASTQKFYADRIRRLYSVDSLWNDILSNRCLKECDNQCASLNSVEEICASCEAKPNNVAELETLNTKIEDLTQRLRKQEHQLFYLTECGNKAKELENDLENKKQLIEFLGALISSREAENAKLVAELLGATKARAELNSAQQTIHRQQERLLRSTQQEEEIVLLKKQIAFIRARENECSHTKRELEKRLKELDYVIAEVTNLKSVNKKLQDEKSELKNQLSNARAQLALLTERKARYAEKAGEEIQGLRNKNEDLTERVQMLLSSHKGEAEEVIYLTWINACLNHELRVSPKALGLHPIKR